MKYPIFFLHLLFCLSGIAGLGYQLVWTRLFSVSLGHEVPSVLSIITAFFGGIGLGSWFLDKKIAQSQNPAKWYIYLEGIIGTWGILSILLIPKINNLILLLIGPTPSTAWQWDSYLPSSLFIAFTSNHIYGRHPTCYGTLHPTDYRSKRVCK